MKNFVVLFIFLVQITFINAQSNSFYGKISPKSILNNPNYETTNLHGDFDLFWDKRDGHYTKTYGVAKNGIIILPNIFSKSGYEYHKDNLLIFSLNSKYGVYNYLTQKWSVPIEYKKIFIIGDNLFSAQKENNKYGIINKENEIVANFNWSNLEMIKGYDNYLLVEKTISSNKKYGVFSIIDSKLTIPINYLNIDPITNRNIFMVTNENNKKNMIDINNNKLFKINYEKLFLPNKSRNFYIVKNKSKMGIINEREEVIVPLTYLDIDPHPLSDGSYVAQNSKGKFGCILIDGKVSLPFDYESFENKGPNNLKTLKNGKCGLVQLNSGAPFEIVTCDYDNLEKSNFIFIVEKNNKFGVLNTFGEVVIPIEYKKIITINSTISTKDLLICSKNNKSYLIDSYGKMLSKKGYLSINIVPRIDGISSYLNYYSYLKVKTKNKKYNLIDKTG